MHHGTLCHSSSQQLKQSESFLSFAIAFTPQYGDSFIELMRLRLIRDGVDADLTEIERQCVNADPNYGLMWNFCKRSPLASTREVLRYARRLLLADLHRPDHAPPTFLSLNNLHVRLSGAERKLAILAIF
jgi:hypothetical protein